MGWLANFRRKTSQKVKVKILQSKELSYQKIQENKPALKFKKSRPKKYVQFSVCTFPQCLCVCSVHIFVHASVSSLDVVASANDRCVEGPLHIAPVCDPLIQSVI